MVLLAILKIIIRRSEVNAEPFLYNLASCTQVFLLGGIIFWLLLSITGKITRKRFVSFKASWLIYLIVITILEISCAWLLRHADVVSGNMYRYLHQYYGIYDMKIAERSYACGRYDAALTYTFKPSVSCRYTNIEFDDTIHTNKMGLRDDDASLIDPDVICLGDSYTMGWGVEQQESFAQVIEKRTGLKVLNAGISSYGTGREVSLLGRLDTSNLKYIVLQFYFNDEPENRAYIKNNYRHPAMPQHRYDSMVRWHEWQTLYFPFKYSLTTTRIAVRDIALWLMNKNPAWSSATIPHNTSYVPKAARNFINILYRSGINFQKTKVLAIDMNRYPHFDHRFIEKVHEVLQDTTYSPEFRKSIHPIDLQELNDRRYFYKLDDHINRDGHQLVAEKLMEKMR